MVLLLGHFCEQHSIRPQIHFSGRERLHKQQCLSSQGTKQFVVLPSNLLHYQFLQGKVPPLPLAKVFTSIPFWAILIGHPCANFGWYMMLVELPLFMRTGLGFDLKAVSNQVKIFENFTSNILTHQNALLSCLPFLCNWICSILYSTSLDKIRQKNLINTTQARKISVTLCKKYIASYHNQMQYSMFKITFYITSFYISCSLSNWGLFIRVQCFGHCDSHESGHVVLRSHVLRNPIKPRRHCQQLCR